jgi:hypothetical protein
MKGNAGMANTNAAFGFRQYRGLGSAPTYEQSVRLIKSDYGTAIYFGDPITPLSTGYIARAAAGTAQIGGIFAGCKYLSTVMKRTVWSNYYPGSDAAADVEAYVIDDPNAQFMVQAGGTAIGLADLGLNVQFNLGTGNSSTGISGAYVESPAVTATLPFRLVGFVQDPPGAPGTDIASAYNRVIVAFNNITSRNNGAGPTGI